MSMKVDLGKILFLILFLTLTAMTALAGTVKGTITDKQTKEPLTGATVQVAGSTQGAVADIDGRYTLQVPDGVYDLVVRYVGYVDINASQVKVNGETILNFEMETDAQRRPWARCLSWPKRIWKANAPCKWSARRPR